MEGVYNMSYLKWKSISDPIWASLLLLVCLPILLILSLFIKIEDPFGSVLFRQERIGQHEHVFTLYKLRSMRTETERDGKALTDEQRLLFIGKFIRTSSLDELPQLINIIKGEMSFIGPRPLLTEYLPYYNSYERKRHLVKPGISGLAQVTGRNTLTWEEKFALDISYITHLSLKQDALIFFLTIRKVCATSDIMLAGRETTKSFVEYRMDQQNKTTDSVPAVFIEKRKSYD